MRCRIPAPRLASALSRSLALLLPIAMLLAGGARSEAASVTDLYLFSVFGTVPSPPAGVSAPFSLTGTAGVRLNLNASAVAAGHAGLLAPVISAINSTVTYQSHSGVIDPGEPGPIATRVNSEVGRMDDVGFVNEGDDAALNIDFKDDARVTLKIPAGGFTRLLIAEDAGLDPFKLERCATADCSGTPQLLFDGFKGATKDAVLARPDFDRGDSSPIDQTYLFLFDAPITGWLRISETSNLGGTRLEVDFVGGLGPDPVTSVPEPTTMILWGTVAAGLACAARRRRREG